MGAFVHEARLQINAEIKRLLKDALRLPPEARGALAVPFILVYRIRSKDIRLLAVQYGRRRPGYWKRRK